MRDADYTLTGLVTSDWHLGSMRNILGQNSIQILLKEIDKVYHYAVTHDIEHVFVPGDLFDTPTPNMESLMAVIHLLHRYEKSGIKTYYIAGNHDFSEKGKTSLDILSLLSTKQMLKNLFVYTVPTLLLIDDVDVGFVPHPELQTMINPNGRGTLNFAHVELDGAVDDSGRELRVSKEHSYQHGVKDFTVSGHIHQHQILSDKAFLYVGTLYQKTYAEKLPKGFLKIQAGYESDGSVHVKVKRIRNTPSFILDTLMVSEDTDYDELGDYIQANRQTKFRLAVDKTVKVPPSFLSNHENIAKVIGAKASKPDESYSNQVKELLDKNEENLTANPKYGLEGYLKSRQHTESEIERSIQLVDEALSQI